MGKGSSSSGAPQQNTITTQDTSIPTYAQPYVNNMLGAAQSQIYNTTTDANGNTTVTGMKPYQPYSSNPADYFAQFSPLQQQAQQSAANMQVAPQIGQASDITGQAAQGALGTANPAMGLGMMGAQAGMSYGQNAQNPNAVQSYMNPYLQATLAPSMQLLNQQYGQQGAAEQGAATSAGAFGGSREALMQGLNQQNQNLAQNQLVSNAYNQAYNTANQNMQAASQLGMQGAGIGLQGVQGAQSAYNLAGQQGQNLMNIGNAGYNQQMGITNLQNQIGAQQTAAQQAIINQAVQNYTNAQQYPYMQLGFESNMLRGLPMSSQTQSTYVGVPNPYTQAISGIGTMANAPGLFSNQAGSASGNAKGGLQDSKKMASGGITQAYDVGGAIKSDLYQMSPQELKQYLQESSSPEAKRMAQEILNEKMPQQMASGGITAVRFEGGGTPEERRAAALDALNQGMPLDYNKYQGEPISKSDYYRQRDLAENAIKRNIPLAPSKESVSARQSAYGLPPKTVTPTAAPVEQPTASTTQPAEQPAANPQAITAAAPAVSPTSSTIGPGGIPLNVGTSPVVPPATQTAPAPTQTETAPTQTAPATTQTAPTDKTGIAAAGMGNISTDDYMSNMMAKLGITKPESPEEYQARREKAIGPDTVTPAQRERIMAERNTQREEAARLKQIRQAEFFANLGTQRGPVLMAIAQSMKETLPKLTEDMKAQGELRRKLDDASYNLDRAERAEKTGDFDAYEKYKADSVKQLTEVGKMATEIYKQKLHNQATMASTEAHERGENARAQQRATHEKELARKNEAQEKIRASQNAEINLSNAMKRRLDVDKEIKEIQKSDAYANALSTVEANKGATDPKKIERKKAAQAILDDANGRIKMMQQDALDDINRARSVARQFTTEQIPKSGGLEIPADYQAVGLDPKTNKKVYKDPKTGKMFVED